MKSMAEVQPSSSCLAHSATETSHPRHTLLRCLHRISPSITTTGVARVTVATHSPYAVEREIEDIEAMIDAAGGEAYLYGHSSGGALALHSAAKPGSRIKKLALYEVPYNDDPQAKSAWKGYISRLTTLLAEGNRGDAVVLFMQYTGMTAGQIAGMRKSPVWAAMEAAAPTLAYDHTAILGREASVPAGLVARVTVPVLVMSGSASFPFMKTTAEILSTIMPNASLQILDGQTHDVSAEALAPLLVEFFQDL